MQSVAFLFAPLSYYFIYYFIFFVMMMSPPPPPDPNVRAWEVVAEGQSVAAGVLEHHRPDGHPHILRRHGPPPPGAAAHELRPSHLLRQHHLLVHPAAGYLWGQQVPGSLCDDDWQNGEQEAGVRGGVTCCTLFPGRFHFALLVSLHASALRRLTRVVVSLADRFRVQRLP